VSVIACQEVNVEDAALMIYDTDVGQSKGEWKAWRHTEQGH